VGAIPITNHDLGVFFNCGDWRVERPMKRLEDWVEIFYPTYLSSAMCGNKRYFFASLAPSLDKKFGTAPPTTSN
jgi:hypothetical protein